MAQTVMPSGFILGLRMNGLTAQQSVHGGLTKRSSVPSSVWLNSL